MKKIYFFITIFLFSNFLNAQDTDEASLDSIIKAYAEIEKSMEYKTGRINFTTEDASLVVPKGFKFLNAEQTQYVLTDLWGNTEDKTVLGAIIPEKINVTDPDCWMFVVNYEALGYVKDDDAKDMNYDDLLKQIKEDIKVENEERKKLGFESVQLIGWASTPFYDDKNKVLHWAKEFKFGDAEKNTLNYDLRILGRKGVFKVAAVASIDQLGEIKPTIPSIIHSIQYNEGAKYENFDSSTDNVAAWTIGGLVAGKVLAKVGFFAVIAKFGKFIAIGFIALFAGARKFLFGNKSPKNSRKEDEIATNETSNSEEKSE
jgi:uncharacterized membrane-anchored protein